MSPLICTKSPLLRGPKGWRQSPRISWRSLGGLDVKTHLFVCRGNKPVQTWRHRAEREIHPEPLKQCPAPSSAGCGYVSSHLIWSFHFILCSALIIHTLDSVPASVEWEHCGDTQPRPPGPATLWDGGSPHGKLSFGEERSNRTQSPYLIFCNGVKLHTRLQILKEMNLFTRCWNISWGSSLLIT